MCFEIWRIGPLSLETAGLMLTRTLVLVTGPALGGIDLTFLRECQVSFQFWPSCLSIWQSVSWIVFYPSKRVEETLASLVDSLAYRLVAEIPDPVNIGQFVLVLCMSNDLYGLDSLHDLLVPECWSSLVE